MSMDWFEESHSPRAEFGHICNTRSGGTNNVSSQEAKIHPWD